MPDSPVISEILKYVTIGGYLAVLLRLWHIQLIREHRWFATYLALVSFRLMILTVVPNGTRLYGHIYFSTLVPTVILMGLAVNEVYTLVLEQHIGLRSLGRKAMGWALGLGTVFALLVSSFAGPNTASKQPLLEQLLVAERSLMLILAVFVIAIALFLSYFPVTLGRNTVVHTALFSAFFLARSAAFWVRSTVGNNSIDAMINAAISITSLVCIVGWLALLRPAALDRKVKAGVHFSAEDEARVLGQLQALNRTLMGSARE